MWVAVVQLGQTVWPLVVRPGFTSTAHTGFLEPILLGGIPCSVRFSGEGFDPASEQCARLC